MIGNFIYFFYDNDSILLYVGKTTGLKHRMYNHFSSQILELETWKKEINLENVVLFKCENLCDLDVYETYFINKYKPKYNRDKVYDCTLSFEPPYLEPIVFSLKKSDVEGNFYTLCKQVVENTASDVSAIYQKYPLIEEAIRKLGLDKIRALGYHATKIQYEIDDFDKKDKIKAAVYNQIEKGKFYSCKDIKITLGFIYTKLGIRRTAKASDITEYCEAKLCCKKMNNKSVKGYQIISTLLNYR